MRILYKITFILAVTLFLIMAAGLFSEVFAQGGPPPGPPPAPRQIPWENLILSLVGCLGYGAFRILFKKR